MGKKSFKAKGKTTMKRSQRPKTRCPWSTQEKSTDEKESGKKPKVPKRKVTTGDAKCRLMSFARRHLLLVGNASKITLPRNTLEKKLVQDSDRKQQTGKLLLQNHRLKFKSSSPFLDTSTKSEGKLGRKKEKTRGRDEERGIKTRSEVNGSRIGGNAAKRPGTSK
ncbi:hypothetical protein RUM44_011547 [Polyplax serrata]|uniref:Uncharacterized protein n=1 Tax=Polyplax serrata TaxID=468196 RepID=A0ABR1AS51_POLSC